MIAESSHHRRWPLAVMGAVAITGTILAGTTLFAATEAEARPVQIGRTTCHNITHFEFDENGNAEESYWKVCTTNYSNGGYDKVYYPEDGGNPIEYCGRAGRGGREGV